MVKALFFNFLPIFIVPTNNVTFLEGKKEKKIKALFIDNSKTDFLLHIS